MRIDQYYYIMRLQTLIYSSAIAPFLLAHICLLVFGVLFMTYLEFFFFFQKIELNTYFTLEVLITVTLYHKYMILVQLNRELGKTINYTCCMSFLD